MVNDSCDIIARMARKRINEEDRNYMVVMVGPTGSGKSAQAVEMARRIDPSFEANPRVVFTPRQFMETIRTMKPGQAIIFDEAGVGISSKEWMKVQVKLIGFVAQLFRHLNLCVIFTVPSINFIEKQVKILMHGIIETKTIDRANKVGVSKYFVIKHNPVYDFTELEPFILFESQGKHTKVDPLYIPHPPAELWGKYLAMKEAYANSFYDNVIKEIAGEKETVDGNRIRKLVNQSKCAIKLLPVVKEHYEWKELEEITGVSQRQMRDWIKEVDKLAMAEV
jgi:energy-coupling factor transporter ATP-binding protein EcfA2